jgi:Co/Zn/Cd efflux system component
VDDCCTVREIPRAHRRALHVVLWTNFGMFLVESASGVAAHSTALLADSIDMLGDAVVYGFSLYVIGRGIVWQARAAMLKGLIMAAFGAGVLAQVAWKIVGGLAPRAEVMSAVGGLALASNAFCLALLWQHRGDDINMRSAWVCSRNDVIGNVGVLMAAAAVGLTGSPWPDVAIGLLVAGVFGRSALQVLREASRTLAR